MKKLLSLILFLSACITHAADLQTGPEILSYVRDRLPWEPLKLSGSLKFKAPNDFTESMPIEMELNWGAAIPTASYRIGEPGSKKFQSLTITWQDGAPNYTFSDPSATPASYILNTGITWADLSFSVLWWPDAKLIKEEKKLNRDCYVVDVPVPDSKNSMRLWIEKNMGMLLEAQTRNAKQKELTRLKIISLKKMEEMWIAKDLELRDAKTGYTTTLQITDLEWTQSEPQAGETIPTETIDAEIPHTPPSTTSLTE